MAESWHRGVQGRHAPPQPPHGYGPAHRLKNYGKTFGGLSTTFLTKPQKFFYMYRSWCLCDEESIDESGLRFSLDGAIERRIAFLLVECYPVLVASKPFSMSELNKCNISGQAPVLHGV